jgi:plastocyanin
MQKSIGAAILAAIVLSVSACSGYGSSMPQSAPDTPPSLPPGAVTVDIVGMNGARSFSPNPATIPVGQTVVWHNLDSTTHRVVLDDGELDTGNIGPGRFSTPMILVAPGAYHCSIHPSMIGAITGS